MENTEALRPFAKRRSRRSKSDVFAGRSRHSHHRTMNFEKYAAEGNHFINLVAGELGADRNTAARITRAVLHAVRDRIPADDAVQFAQGLPMAIKGVFFDQYDLSRVPVVIRHPRDFIAYVRYMDGGLWSSDMRNENDVEDAIAAVFRVLERTMDYGQVEQIKRTFNEELAYLLY